MLGVRLRMCGSRVNALYDIWPAGGHTWAQGATYRYIIYRLGSNANLRCNCICTKLLFPLPYTAGTTFSLSLSLSVFLRMLCNADESMFSEHRRQKFLENYIDIAPNKTVRHGRNFASKWLLLKDVLPVIKHKGLHTFSAARIVSD